jgi:hypothetical protein
MNEFVTVISFTYPSELTVAKLKLEAEGIECRVLDELTIQSYNFVSNAVGGVKLQVRTSDAERATMILKDSGFIANELTDRKTPETIAQGKRSANILKVFGLVFMVLALALIVGGIIFKYATLPTVSERLTSSAWCLDHIVYGEDVYYPTSKRISLRLAGSCEDHITFNPDGGTQIPGFGYGYLNGNWEVYGDSVVISNLDSFEHIYTGRYQIEFDRRNMYLYSYSTMLVCYREL